MRKNILKKTVAGLIIVLSFVGVAKAGDSISFSVSCTIPAVPGVNAPPFPTEKSVEENRDTNIIVQEQTETYAKNEPTLIQEDAEEEIVLAEGKTTTITVQTIYAR